VLLFPNRFTLGISLPARLPARMNIRSDGNSRSGRRSRCSLKLVGWWSFEMLQCRLKDVLSVSEFIVLDFAFCPVSAGLNLFSPRRTGRASIFMLRIYGFSRLSAGVTSALINMIPFTLQAFTGFYFVNLQTNKIPESLYN